MQGSINVDLVDQRHRKANFSYLYSSRARVEEGLTSTVILEGRVQGTVGTLSTQ